MRADKLAELNAAHTFLKQVWGALLKGTNCIHAYFCLAMAKLRCSTREPVCAPRADTFHKPGFKMHVKILHHLFGVVSGDVIKAPLWDVAALGPAAYPSNAVFVHHHVTQLLTTSFPNMRAPQVEVRRPCSASSHRGAGARLIRACASREHAPLLIVSFSFSFADSADEVETTYLLSCIGPI